MTKAQINRVFIPAQLEREGTISFNGGEIGYQAR